MVFCFLSTAVLYIASLSVFIISTVITVINYQTQIFPGGILMLISFCTTVLAHIGAKKLYDSSMSVTAESFDKWYSKQLSISKRCFRSSRMAVLLNIAFVCCAFERTDEARLVLTQVRPLIDRHGNAYYRYIYLMSVLAYKEKTHDMSYVSELIAEIYAIVRSPIFPKYESRTDCLDQCDYALAELQLYIRDPRQLSDPDKQLALRLRQLALELSSKESFLSEIIGYSRLSYYYNAGLAAAILGDLVDADRFFGYIASSPCGFPICDRARTFLIDRDISALMKTIP